MLFINQRGSHGHNVSRGEKYKILTTIISRELWLLSHFICEHKQQLTASWQISNNFFKKYFFTRGTWQSQNLIIWHMTPVQSEVSIVCFFHSQKTFSFLVVDASSCKWVFICSTYYTTAEIYSKYGWALQCQDSKVDNIFFRGFLPDPTSEHFTQFFALC